MAQKQSRLHKTASFILGVLFVGTGLPLAISAPFFQHDAALMAKARAEHLDEEGKLMGLCTSMLGTMSPAQIDAFEDTDKYRDCLLTTAPKVQTDIGAILFGYRLVHHLARHPEDAAVKTVAQSLIERGMQWRQTHFSAIQGRMEREVTFARLSLPVRYYVPANFISRFNDLYTAELVKVKLALDDPAGFEKAQKQKMEAALAEAHTSAGAAPASGEGLPAVGASAPQ
jgi:hypothetical protein